MIDETPELRRHHRENGDQQRDDVIDEAIKHERAEHRIDVHGVAEPCDDDRLEDTEARRHVAQHAEPDGDRVDGQKGRPADRGVRQQHVKHGSGSGDIENGDQELPRPGKRVGQAHVELTNRQHPAAAPDDQKQREQSDDDAGKQPQPYAANGNQRPDLVGHDQKRDRADGRKPEAEGKRDEGDDAGDFFGRQAKPGIGAIADRTGAERAEAGGVADGIGAERG